MRRLFTSLIAVSFLAFAGLNLTSCENGTQSTKTETQEQFSMQEEQSNKAGYDAANKEPTLDQMVQYQNEMEAKLAKLDKRIEELKIEAEKGGAEINAAIKKEIEELDWKKEYVRIKLDELKSASVVAWNDVKSELSSAIDDLEKSYEEVISEFKGEQAIEPGIKQQS